MTLTSLDVLLLLLRLTLSASSECLCWWRCSLARASSCSMMANCCSRSGKWKSVDCSQTLEKSVKKLELSFLSCTYLFQTVTVHVFQSFFSMEKSFLSNRNISLKDLINCRSIFNEIFVSTDSMHDSLTLL